MGGAGVAFSSPTKINYLNPAAMTAGPQGAVLFNVGLEGDNYYLKSENKSSSFNSFNIRDIALQLPLSKRTRAGVSVTPFSSVGYRVYYTGVDPEMPGVYEYSYEGSGGITQLKISLAHRFGKRLSLGAEMVYYLGNIDRSFDVGVANMTTGSENMINAYADTKISRFFANMGLQYNVIMTEKETLTIGAAFQPSGMLNPRVERMVPAGDIYGDTISFDSQLVDFKMPDMASAGISYRTPRICINADYSYQGWGVNGTSGLSADGVTYRNTNAFKLGGEFTPDRFSARSFFKRTTYRLGVRYSDYYMTFNGHDVDEKAVTFGVGIPVRQGNSSINLGVELGSRGSIKYNMIREDYVKFSIGLSLFGEDGWFWKPKYD